MRRLTLIAALISLLAMPATAAAAPSALAPTPSVKASVDECGIVTSRRLTGASFSGEMSYLTGSDTMWMRFELLTRAPGEADFADSGGLLGHRLAQAVHLDEQDGARVHRIAHVQRRLYGADDLPIHHLQRGGDDAAGDDGGDGLARLVHLIEDGEESVRGLRPAQEPHDDLGDDAQRPLRADEDAAQVVAGRLARATP